MIKEHAIDDEENEHIETIFDDKVKEYMKILCLQMQNGNEIRQTEFRNLFRTDFEGFRVQVNDVQPHNWTRKLYFNTQNAYSTYQVHDVSGEPSGNKRPQLITNTQTSIDQPLEIDISDIEGKKVKTKHNSLLTCLYLCFNYFRRQHLKLNLKPFRRRFLIKIIDKFHHRELLVRPFLILNLMKRCLHLHQQYHVVIIHSHRLLLSFLVNSVVHQRILVTLQDLI